MDTLKISTCTGSLIMIQHVSGVRMIICAKLPIELGLLFNWSREPDHPL